LNRKVIKSDLLLLLTSAIWGFAFVAQRDAMDHIGPFLYNSLRFTLGCLVLLPFVLRKKTLFENSGEKSDPKLLLKGGILAGVILFCGASLQQYGLVTTTAGKAGFITGLYVVIVPILAILWRQRVAGVTWAGAILAGAGLYLLSIRNGMNMETGDLLILIGAFVWAAHVHVIGLYSPKVDPLRMAFIQFAVTGILSILVTAILEPVIFASIIEAWLPVLYGGVMSAGIAFTLQIFAQREVPSSHAAIIMSSETVFAAFGGWLLLGETMDSRAILGCSLMLLGILVSQLYKLEKKDPN